MLGAERVEVVGRGELPASGAQPARAWLDLAPARLSSKARLALDVDRPDVLRARLGQHAPRTVRLVLELASGVAPEVVRWEAPRVRLPRLETAPLVFSTEGEVDLAAIVADVRASLAEPTPKPRVGKPRVEKKPVLVAPAKGRASKRRRLRNFTIVVDAGHGGRDHGATGVGKLREKDVNLAVARALASALRDDGAKVVMTRDDDRALSLEERVAIAHAAQADLLVSVHANAHESDDARGIETFCAKGSIASGTRAARLARAVQTRLVKAAGKGRPAVRDLGVKTARFFVLVASRMPAILVETGFITHPKEGRALARPRHRVALGRAIAGGVADYVDAQSIRDRARLRKGVARK